MLQRTKEWYKARLGRFTASGISALLGEKLTHKKTMDSIENYAFKKAVETVFGVEDDRFISEDMQRGISQEPLAFELFKESKKYDFIEVEETGFHKYKQHAGASPDGLVSDNSVLEIKCPRRLNFFKVLATNEIDSKYMAQMQMQMLCTNSENAYFYNYYLYDGVQHKHEIIVPRNEKMIDLIKERLDIAIEKKLDYISKIKSNKQF